MALILGLVLAFQGPPVLFAVHLGEGAFYRVVPYIAMTVPPLLIALYGLAVFTIGAVRFWRETQGNVVELIDFAALWRATKDAFGLAYLKGGGAGCNYPGESFSQTRLWLHHAVFLRLSARFGRDDDRRVLRSFSGLAGALSLLQRAGGSWHGWRDHVGRRHGRAAYSEMAKRPRSGRCEHARWTWRFWSCCF